MELLSWDEGGPNTGLFRDIGVVNFSVRDPENDDNSYCIGFRFNGEDCRNPNNYEFDHVNSFREDLDPVKVSREKLEAGLKSKNVDLGELLIKYISIF
ncbi:MAG: hypothetical protein AABY05_02655 [Nanoarchaeota archaeon]